MIVEYLNKIAAIIWGPPLIGLLLGTGIYLCFISRFWQFRHFIDSFKYCFFPSNDNNDKDFRLTQYKAASTAIAASIGAGNIGGVASAIALGGPGVLFWMWVCALIGMITKMAEITLSVYYRETDSEGKHRGGPLYYMQKGVGKRFKGWKILAVLFSIGICSQMFVAPDTFTVGEAISELTGTNPIYGSLFFAVMCWVVILGGLKRVVNFAAIMMPLMSSLYLIFGLYVIAINYQNIPDTIYLVVRSAFTPTAAVGGFVGSTMMLGLRTGIERGLCTNEAGWGTSPMIQSTAENNHPVEQGMWGIVEVFITTMIVCTITALVVLVTGEWSSGEAGATLTIRAFAHGLGDFAPYFICIVLFLFCWTTSAGWFTFILGIIEFAFKNHVIMRERMARILKFIVPGFGLLIAILINVWNIKLTYAWLMVSFTSALPTLTNCIALLLLSKTFIAIVADYEGAKKLWGLRDYDKEQVDC